MDGGGLFPATFPFALEPKTKAFPRLLPPKNGFPEEKARLGVQALGAGSLALALPEQTHEEYMVALETHLKDLHSRHAVVRPSKQDRRVIEEERRDAPLLAHVDVLDGEEDGSHDFGADFDTEESEYASVNSGGEQDEMEEERGCCC
jgi:hypothetical protein